MSRGVAMLEYAKKTSAGMYKAHKAYEDWSGDLWVWNAPEYLLTTYIAREIAKIRYKPFYLTLEQHVGEALGGAGASEDIVESAGKQKFDIVVWWGSDAPRGIIEVKRQVASFSGGETGYGGIKQDVERMIESLKETSLLQFGLMAYYTSCKYGERPSNSAEVRIMDRVKKISSEARKCVPTNMKFRRIPGKINIWKDDDIGDGPNDHAWVAEVLMIWKPKK